MSRRLPDRWPSWPDLVLPLVLGLLAASMAQWGAAAIGPRIAETDSYDLWFQSDPPRVFENLTNRDNMQSRSRVHPLFALLGYPPVFLLRRIAGSDWGGVRIFMFLQTLAWVALVYGLLRLAQVRRWDAALFTMQGMVSGAFIFWSTVPETYTLGSVAIMLALGLAIIAGRRPVPDVAFIGVAAAGLAVTITNAMASLLATLAHRRWRRTLMLFGGALLLVLGLGLAQKVIFPRTVLFVSGANLKEVNYLFAPTPDRLLATGAGFLYHSMVMPEPRLVDSERGSRLILSTAGSNPGSGSRWGLAGVLIWTVLVGLGVATLIRMGELRPLRLVLAGTLLGQLTLHTVHGEEAFLYSLHWLPLLILLAALATRTRSRWIVLSLAAMLFVCTGVNNAMQFSAVLQRLAELWS